MKIFIRVNITIFISLIFRFHWCTGTILNSLKPLKNTKIVLLQPLHTNQKCSSIHKSFIQATPAPIYHSLFGWQRHTRKYIIHPRGSAVWGMCPVDDVTKVSRNCEWKNLKSTCTAAGPMTHDKVNVLFVHPVEGKQRYIHWTKIFTRSWFRILILCQVFEKRQRKGRGWK